MKAEVLKRKAKSFLRIYREHGARHTIEYILVKLNIKSYPDVIEEPVIPLKY